MSTVYASRSRAGRPVQLTAPKPVTGGDPPGFRPDIEGLRAVAVLLVVLGHAGVARLGGGYVGVDVFFVISGFLITTLLLKELAPGGTISIARFYARRATRLLPASTLVLVTTLAAAWCWLPPVRFPSIVADALAGTFYGINYRLAIEGSDYLNATAAPSPLQHFWSLSVEEQFYLIWPVLLLTAARAGRGHRTMNRFPIAIALLALIAVSLYASVRQTGVSAPWAYFGGHTRAWELAVGGLLALGTGVLARGPRLLAAALTWLGLGAVLAAALIFDERTAFPGHAAALPVAGAAMVIAGGCAAPRGGAGLLLNQAPSQLIGRLSYGWYLWHWPVLMIAPSALGARPGLWLNLALCAGALLVAAGSYAWVEQPIRRRRSLSLRPVRGIGLGLTLSGAAAALALFAGTATPTLSGGGSAVDSRARLAAASDPAAELASLLVNGSASVPSNLTPRLDVAADDQSPVYADGCHLDLPTVRPAHECAYGDPTSSTTVVLFGDSHAAHWFPALDAIARDRGWRLLSLTKSACPAASVRVNNPVLKRPYDECSEWRDRTLRLIREERPALVVMSSSGGESGGLVDPPAELDRAWTNAWVSSVRAVESDATRVVFISDTPWPERHAPECVSGNLDDVGACARDTGSALPRPERRAMVEAAIRAEGATVIDPTAWFCAGGACPVIAGNVLVYNDDSHMSATYSRLLAPLLADAIGG